MDRKTSSSFFILAFMLFNWWHYRNCSKYLIKSNIPTIESVKPYTPFELQGRDIYVREGCYICHSQMIRPFRSETERYGEYSKAENLFMIILSNGDQNELDRI